MADWKSIPDTDVDPDAPVTSELMYALRDNPVAIAEGASGAPRVMPRALNSNLLAYIKLSYADPFGVNDIAWLRSFSCFHKKKSATSPVLQISFSTDYGASWGGWQNVYTLPANDVSASFEIDLELMSIKGLYITDSDVININSTISVPTGINSFRFRHSTTSISLLEIRATGGRSVV